MTSKDLQPPTQSQTSIPISMDKKEKKSSVRRKTRVRIALKKADTVEPRYSASANEAHLAEIFSPAGDYVLILVLVIRH